MRTFITTSLCVTLLLTLTTLPLQADKPSDLKKEGFVALFNGKDLDNFEQRNGTAIYRIEKGGIILGKTKEGSPNSFLCTKKQYGDFELMFEVKVDNQLNSGVQIRSASRGGKKSGRVRGPQVVEPYAALVLRQLLARFHGSQPVPAR